MYLIFDTETTGLPKNFNAPISDTDNWPRCIQIAWQLHDAMGNLVESQDYLIQPDGFNIPFDAEKIHGISTELAEKEGIPLDKMLALLMKPWAKPNLSWDRIWALMSTSWALSFTEKIQKPHSQNFRCWTPVLSIPHNSARYPADAAENSNCPH